VHEIHNGGCESQRGCLRSAADLRRTLQRDPWTIEQAALRRIPHSPAFRRTGAITGSSEILAFLGLPKPLSTLTEPIRVIAFLMASRLPGFGTTIRMRVQPEMVLQGLVSVIFCHRLLIGYSLAHSVRGGGVRVFSEQAARSWNGPIATRRAIRAQNAVPAMPRHANLR